MKVFLLVMLCLVVWRIVSPNRKLYDFNAQATLPLRGILALFIIFHHVSQRYDFTLGLSFWEHYPSLSFNLFSSMGGPVVGVFFFLTGYGLSKSLSLKGDSYLKGFIPKRFLNTLPEFVFLTILVSVILIVSGYENGEELLMKMRNGYTPLPYSWFMYAITYIYVAFYISALISKGNVTITGCMLTLFIFIYVFITWRLLHWGGWWYISTLSVLVGYFVANFERYVDEILSSRIWLISLLLLFVFSCLAVKLSGIGSGVLQTYGLVVLTYACIRLYRMPQWKLLLWIGGISLNVYLIHGLFVMAFQKVELNPCIALIGITTLSCLTAYGLKEIRKNITSKKLTNKDIEKA